MLIDTAQARIALPPGQLARIALAPHTRLRGLAGQSWVTLDNDPRDIVLGPGDEVVVQGGGNALACALTAGGLAELLVAA